MVSARFLVTCDHLKLMCSVHLMCLVRKCGTNFIRCCRFPSQHPLTTCRWFSYAQCSLRSVSTKSFFFGVSSGVSTVALFGWVAKSETEHIDRVVKPLFALLNKTLHSGGPEDHFSSMLQDVVSEASALAAWGIAKKYHAKDLLMPVSAPNSAEAAVALFSPSGSPSTSFHAQAWSMGEKKFRRTTPHGTRLVNSPSGCSWGPGARLFTPVAFGELLGHRTYRSDGLSIPRRCAVQVIRPWVGSAKVSPQS